MRLKTLALWVSASIVAGGLLGCASPAQLADQVVSANVAQEEATNRLMLLNVVRAKFRHPMHFTRVSAVRPAAGFGNPTFTLPMPFGPDFKTQIYNVQSQFGVQQGSDSAALDSQEFIRGIMTPVPAATMTYLLDQGWPQQMVLLLLMRSIEIYEERVPPEGGRPRPVLIQRLENNPTSMAQFGEFKAAIDGLRNCEIGLKTGVVGKSSWSPTFGKEVFSDLKGLAAAKAADLLVVPVDEAGKETTGKPTGYRLMKEQKGTQLELRDRPESPQGCGGVRFLRKAADGKAQVGFASFGGVLPPDEKEAVSPRESGILGQLVQTAASKPYALFAIRSPEAVLYYLGEIARREEAARKRDDHENALVTFRSQPQPGGREDEIILFRLQQRQAVATAGVAVDYRGESYVVEASPSGQDRSMHTLSLLNQILLLQNKGAEAPTTTNIRLLQ
jgi:hypothetical protein